MTNDIQAFFLDRDGTINVDHGYVYRSQDFAFVPGAIEALKIIARKKIPMFIITNQAGIARGLYTETDFAQLTAWMIQVLLYEGVHFQDVLYCPHHEKGVVPEFTMKCSCRKPEPGMITRVLEREGFDPKKTIMIGDKPSDAGAGRAAGTQTVLLSTGDLSLMETPDIADYVVPDLRAAVSLILGE